MSLAGEGGVWHQGGEQALFLVFGGVLGFFPFWAFLLLQKGTW